MAKSSDAFLGLGLDDALTRRQVLQAGLAGAATIGLAACGQAEPTGGGATGPDFKVGAVLPSSKVYAELGTSITNGMKLYFDKVGNKAGGRKIVLLLEDEEATPDVALAKTRKLVEQDNVDMIAGYVASPDAVGARDYLDQNAMPTLIANAGANVLSRAKKSPYIYRASFSNWQPSHPMGAYVAENITKKVTLLYANYAAGSEAAGAFKETFTGTILAEVKPPLNNQDYSTYISQIRASKPEAIYFFLSGTDANNFFTQAKQVDLFANIKVTGAGFGVEQDVTQAIGDKSPVGAITGLHWAYTLDNKENKDFTTAYKSRYGRLADVFAMQGYDTARVIAEALNAVKGKTDDKPAFLKAIAAVKFKSPRGDFRFDSATNNVVNPIYIRELVKDPSLGYVNKVKTTIASVADPGQ
ncbi:MAG: ABC transporter substrate-binding protein [Chloroflexi bacterium]|nr:MAG: ABC transporter substrate-binding protein [Chloroflexota bacterium]